MHRLPGSLAVVSALLLAGCSGTVVLKADFQSFPAGGLLPGKPEDDHVLVGANVVFSDGKLILHSPPPTSAKFFSRPVQKPDATKNIFWRGRLKLGNVPVDFWVCGENTVGPVPLGGHPCPDALKLSLSRSKVEVIDGSGLKSHTPDPPLNPNTAYEVFMSFQLSSGTYYISVQEPISVQGAGALIIDFTGPLHPLTINSLKNHSRLALWVSLGQILGSSAANEYEMDDLVMREMN